MGGRGSGNWYNHHARRRYGTVETVPFVLDIRVLARSGAFVRSRKGGRLSGTSRHGDGVVREWSAGVDVDLDLASVTIRHDAITTEPGQPEQRERVAVTIGLDWTPCHFGGRRPWFECPECDRRVAILYGTTRWNRFGWRCRACSGLRYACSREGLDARAARRVRRIRRDVFRLTGKDANPRDDGGVWRPPRPRYMHWTTYYRRLAELDDAEEWANVVWWLDLARAASRWGSWTGNRNPALDHLLARTPRRWRDWRSFGA